MYGLRPMSIYLWLVWLVSLGSGWMTKMQTNQTSGIFRWMFKSGPLFCSFTEVSSPVVFRTAVLIGDSEMSKLIL